MKTFAIVVGVMVAMGIAIASFEETAETRYSACQGERCIDIEYFTVSQGCLIEATETGELRSQIVCGSFIVKQNHQ